MGCGSSVVAAPEQLLPDPAGPSKFILSRVEQDEEDFIAYRRIVDIDSSTDVLLDRVAFHDEAGTSAARWLYLRRLGSFFEEGKVVLENFHRGGDAENKNRGEVLWTCNFDGNPDFDREYASDSTEDGEDEWSDDDYTEFKRKQMLQAKGHHMLHCMKWKMWTRCHLVPDTSRPGSVTAEQKPWVLKIKAKGNATRRVKRRRGHSMLFDYKDTERVKRISYKMYPEDRDDNDVANHLEEHRWVQRGRPNTYDEEFTWDGPLFKGTTIGGSKKNTGPDSFALDTKEPFDPSLSLIVSYLAATEFTPDRVKQDFHPHWDAAGNYYSSESDNNDDSGDEAEGSPKKLKRRASSKVAGDAPTSSGSSLSAEEHRLRGNKKYAQCDWPGAIKSYERALEQDAKNAVLLANMSAALLMQGSFDESLEYADKAVAVDPQYMKGFLRKGCALRALNRATEAETVLNHAKEMEPDNTALKQVISTILTPRDEVEASTSTNTNVDWVLE